MKAIFRRDAADARVEEVSVGDSQIRAFALYPKAAQTKEGADSALLMALVLALPDATLVTGAFYVTPGLVKDAGCTRFVEAWASSLRVGTRALERAAGPRTVAFGGVKVVLDVPADHVLVRKDGGDFMHGMLKPLRRLGRYPGDLNIIVDGHPNPELPEGAVPVAGTLFGKKMQWQMTSRDNGGIFTATQEVRNGVSVQLVGRATLEKAQLDAFRALAEKARLEK